MLNAHVCIYRFKFDTIRILRGGILRFDEDKNLTRVLARLLIVDGKLIAGTEDAPFLSHLEFVLTGNSSDQNNTKIHKEIVGHGTTKLPYSKVLLARNGSTVSLHGKPKHSWIKLADTAKAGSSTLVLKAYPRGWEVRDIIRDIIYCLDHIYLCTCLMSDTLLHILFYRSATPSLCLQRA